MGSDLPTEPAHILWTPNAFLVNASASMEPGDALDIGMGSGRNALHLARKGWQVVGLDISKVGVETAKSRAAADKLTLDAIHGDMLAYDYGKSRFDLILFMYMGPLSSGLGQRVVDALKPGGHLLIEHYAGGFEQGSLPRLFPRLEVIRYEESEDFPHWDQEEKAAVVRFLARKPTANDPIVGR